MAEKAKPLDVWIVETNTVYREVPYTVVADWVQQGRLLENDMLRPSGTAEWSALATMPAFAVYLPRAEPHRAEDRASSEPVQLDLAWKRRREDEDEDVDMIPLIDVSLVLLIFFMMTATVTAVAHNTPRARYGMDVTSDPRVVWVDIEQRADGEPTYSLGQGEQRPEQGLSEEELLGRLDRQLSAGQAIEVDIRPDEALPYEIFERLVVYLEKYRARGNVGKIQMGVSREPNP